MDKQLKLVAAVHFRRVEDLSRELPENRRNQICPERTLDGREDDDH
jgi:hypothetical protein